MEEIMTDEEYLEKYQKEYGFLDEEEKKHVLKCKHEYDNMTEEEKGNILKTMKEFIDSPKSTNDCSALDDIDKK